MQNTINQQELVELIKTFFEEGYDDKDYAKLWVDVINPVLNNHREVLQMGPSKSKAILLGQNENIHLWHAPAGNIPKNEPKIIVIGQATSITALEYIMKNINSNSTEQKVRSILIKSCFRGKMLGNLGVVVNYLNLRDGLKSELDLNNEWANFDDAMLSTNHNPKGRLFENPLESDIMFSQWCMHCGTAFSSDTNKHNTSSVNMKKFKNLYEIIFPLQNYQLIKEKFILSNGFGLLIVLGENQYEQLREIYESKFPNVSWISVNRDASNHLLESESLKLDPKTKFVTWIPHPSPGNPFFNRSVNKIGVMDSLVSMDEQLNLENSEEIINKACIDYPKSKRQASQMVFLRMFFNN